MEAPYDSIGVDYSQYRQPDPNIATAICDALGDAETVVNVGAGSGSYEPNDRYVVAVELSRSMIDQRSTNSPECVQASAMALPFRANSFDAALALLTVHHWEDRA
jgi:ubiquinone/menaquinone biosynthesis C-methylase UbiE